MKTDHWLWIVGGIVVLYIAYKEVLPMITGSAS